MTDAEFQRHLGRGIDIKGQRVTGRVLPTDPHRYSNGTQADSPFVIQINHGDELSIRFASGERLESRMAKLDAAIERWLTLRPANRTPNP